MHSVVHFEDEQSSSTNTSNHQLELKMSVVTRHHGLLHVYLVQLLVSESHTFMRI